MRLKDPAARWSEEELKHTAVALRQLKDRGNFSAAIGGVMKRHVLRDDEARAKGSFRAYLVAKLTADKFIL